MPGSNARALEKAKSLPADVFIFDLEDAVAPEVKQKARDQVLAAVKAGGFGDCELVIRVNGLRTEWGDADLRAAAAAGPDAVLLPKVSSCDDVCAAAKILREAAPSRPVPLWAMIETPLAILNVAAIASMPGDNSLRPAVMVMGVNDLAKETRALLTPGREAIVPWLMSCVAAARAYGIGLLDGVWNDLSDSAGLERECLQGRNLGMDGKTLIHPNQIGVCNDVFAPEEAEIDWASKVIAEFAKPENAAKGAVQLDGRMVERLHMETAQQVLELAKAARARRARS
jgi:citrate lyase subunit beta/citryl-CoA lyase